MHPLSLSTRVRAAAVVGAAAALAVALIGAVPSSAAGSASISGTVTDASGPVAGTYVAVELPAGSVVGTAYTGSDGTYSVPGLNAASYRVQFYGDFAHHSGQFWKGASSLASATPIVIRGSEAVAGIDARLAPGGTVAGSVSMNGAPASGVNVAVVAADGSDAGFGFTASDGTYALTGITPGTYSVEFSLYGHPTTWWNGHYSRATADPVVVADGQTTGGIDGTVPIGGSISGTVAGSVPLSNAAVEVFDSTGNQIGNPGSVGSDGRYSVTGLAPGSYTVELTHPYGSTAVATQWWQGQPTRFTATPVVVGTDAAVSSIDFAAQGAVLSGHVTDAAGAADTSALVQIYRTSGSDPSTGPDPYSSIDYANTDESGAYSITGLAAGDYVVRFSDQGGGGSTMALRRSVATPSDETAPSVGASQWWKGASTEAAATRVTIGAGASVSGIDATLQAGGSISGTISERLSTGAVISNQTVFYKLLDSTGTEVPTIGMANPDGTYEIDGVPAGSYTIEFYAPGGPPYDFGSVWWRNKPDAASATPIVLRSGQARTGIDGTLPSADLRVGAVSVSGTPTVGNTLAARTSGWGPAGVAFTYQWLRDGTAIAGATDRTYRLTNADAAHTIAVAVPASRSGSPSETLTSDPTASVTGGKLTTAKPTIAGVARPGSTLTADPGTWGPGTVSFAYQWLRNGTPIGTATSATYTLGSADVGARIAVAVTGSAPGFDPATRTSGSTAKVTN